MKKTYGELESAQTCLKLRFRYDAQDPCKASAQLITGFVKWSSTYNRNCKAENEAHKFIERIAKDFVKVEKKLQKKLAIC